MGCTAGSHQGSAAVQAGLVQAQYQDCAQGGQTLERRRKHGPQQRRARPHLWRAPRRTSPRSAARVAWPPRRHRGSLPGPVGAPPLGGWGGGVWWCVGLRWRGVGGAGWRAGGRQGPGGASAAGMHEARMIAVWCGMWVPIRGLSAFCFLYPSPEMAPVALAPVQNWQRPAARRPVLPTKGMRVQAYMLAEAERQAGRNLSTLRLSRYCSSALPRPHLCARLQAHRALVRHLAQSVHTHAQCALGRQHAGDLACKEGRVWKRRRRAG